MPDSVNLQLDWLSDVVSDQFKSWMANPLSNVAFSSCEVVVKANNFFACLHETISEVGA